MSETPLDTYGIGRPFEGSSGRLVAGRGWLARQLRRWVRMRYLDGIGRQVPPGARLLEFGCGGGDAWLAATYRMTGLELAENAARAARRLYPEVLVAGVQKIPVPPASFDAAASIFVLEHLPFEVAESALRELHRVLVHGGRLVCVCDLECDHPLLKWARERHPLGYREAYIDLPGHLGLRREHEWRRLLEATGFRVVEWRLKSRLPVFDPAPWVQLSTSRHFPHFARNLGRLVHRVCSLPRVGPCWTLGVTLADTLLCPVLPKRWAYRLLFVAEAGHIQS